MKGLEVALVLILGIITPNIKSQKFGHDQVKHIPKNFISNSNSAFNQDNNNADQIAQSNGLSSSRLSSLGIDPDDKDLIAQIKAGNPYDLLQHYQSILDSNKNPRVGEHEEEHLRKEQENGDPADMRENNRHRYVPAKFPDLSRRFVLQYPYTEKEPSQVNEDAEGRLNEAVKAAIDQIAEDERLRPVKAPPSVVLAIARQSALAERSKPAKKRDEAETESLRTGDYWNAVWKEDVPDPAKAHLRTDKHIESLRVKIMPGSKLHKLVSLTKDFSPRYLYIMNNANDVNDDEE